MQRRQLLKAALVAPVLALVGRDEVSSKTRKTRRYVGATQVWNLEEICASSRRGVHNELIEYSIVNSERPDEYILQMTVTEIPESCRLSRHERYEPLTFEALENAIDDDEGLVGFIRFVQWSMLGEWYNTFDRYQAIA